MTKRYDEYKDSGIEWLGEIPSHWNESLFRRKALKITDGSHHSPKTIDEGKNYVSVKDVLENGEINIIDSKKISNDDFIELEKNGCRPKLNDVLITKDGTIGRSAIVKDDDFVILSSLGLIRMGSKFDSRYIRYTTISNHILNIIYSSLAGSALKRITIEKIKNLPILIPEIKEQQAIADYLDNKTSKIDSAVAELEKHKSLLIELKKSTIHQAVTKGLDLTLPMVAKNNRLKDSVYVISSGLNEFNGVKNYLSTKSIGEQGIKQIEAEVSFEKRPSRANMQPQMNSLWTAYMQGSKKFLFVDDFDICKNYIISTGMFGFKVKNGNNPEYFSYLLQSNVIESQKNRRAKGTTQISINDSDFKNMIVNLPDKNEQDKIVLYLNKKTEQIYKSIKIIDEQVNKMKEYKKTLINDVVTGKIKVV
jgi:type I restriction enzyme S subunit